MELQRDFPDKDKTLLLKKTEQAKKDINVCFLTEKERELVFKNTSRWIVTLNTLACVVNGLAFFVMVSFYASVDLHPIACIAEPGNSDITYDPVNNRVRISYSTLSQEFELVLL